MSKRRMSHMNPEPCVSVILTFSGNPELLLGRFSAKCVLRIKACIHETVSWPIYNTPQS